mgnify:CR=1 FL=1
MSKFASLTAGLLARKGEAEPTATPFADQLLTRVGAPAPDLRALTPMQAPAPTAAPLVHAHIEPSFAKPQGLKPPAPKPLDPTASPFGTFGRRSTPDQKREAAKAEPAKAAPLAVVPGHEEDEHAESHCASCPGPSAEEAGKTYHVNLRLKRLRFVKLKLAAALMRRPVQEIVAEALDQWFDKLPPEVMGECACLKARGD